MVRVWAPRSEAVRLVINGSQIRMCREERGWWASGEEVAPGVEYGFSLDGHAPLPDPRSPWQPHGLLGMSKAFDPTAYDWQSTPPRVDLTTAVIYELHVGTFTPEGTLSAAANRLNHILDLGVSVIELMPVAAFAGVDGWGYDAVLPYAVHDPYGGPQELLSFVDQCHQLGLAVFIDIVHNHFGPGGGFLETFGPYFSSSALTPWGPAPNFDGPGSLHVRTFFIESAVRLAEDYHVDGFRVDAASWIDDKSPTHYLADLAEALHLAGARDNRSITILAEGDNQPRFTASRSQGGYELTGQWSKDFHHALHAVLTGETAGYYSDYGSVGDVATALTDGFVYAGRYCPSRDRIRGAPLDGPVPVLVGYLQNHDEVGNRDDGARIATLVGPELAMAAAPLVLLSAHLPLIFQGEEWGSAARFDFFQDVGAGTEISGSERIVAHTRARSRDDSLLRWDELARPEARGCLDWYRHLLALRRTHSDLRNLDFARVRVEFDESSRCLLMERGRIAVATNLSSRHAVIRLGGSALRVLATFGSMNVEDDRVALGPAAACVIETGLR